MVPAVISKAILVPSVALQSVNLENSFCGHTYGFLIFDRRVHFPLKSRKREGNDFFNYCILHTRCRIQSKVVWLNLVLKSLTAFDQYERDWNTISLIEKFKLLASPTTLFSKLRSHQEIICEQTKRGIESADFLFIPFRRPSVRKTVTNTRILKVVIEHLHLQHERSA